MKILLHLIAVLTIVVMSFIVGLGFYWGILPEKVIDINNAEKVSLNKSVYHPGDRIEYTLDYCKYKKNTASIQRALVNGTRLVFTELISDLPTGCHVTKVQDLVIPEFVDVGTYHLEATVEYKLNPIRNYVTYWRTSSFKIVK